ncbi:MAG: (R,R)-butanediol dehydrogenase / meso-butanediol dehydrogenase / diacetyl reductase [Acidimicrobiia bacterium]|nr:(R,R)-butanediol dehydrogenase / meso-butanediol dehydrogenase / diacetyl reductase [Acidimicrobiia bacterium]
MRAGVIRGKGLFELADVAEPEAGEDQAVVDIIRCGICGSDVHAYVEGWPYNPGICGHEWVGVVRATAPGERLVSEGDRVVGGMAPGCGVCAECRASLPEYCANARAAYAGRRAPASGGFARSMALDANRLCKLPAAVDDVSAAIIEPASVAMHGVRRSRMRVGDLACVVGCGPIGLLTIQCARIAGAGHIVAVEPDAHRRERALAMGADAAFAPGAELREHVNERTAGLRADIAFDCAGVPQTLQQSVDLVRRGGSVCMIGVSGGEATVVPMRWMGKEVSVDTSLVFTLEEMAIVAGLIADGRLRTVDLHDATVELDALGKTIDDLANRRLSAVKVLVDPTAG